MPTPQERDAVLAGRVIMSAQAWELKFEISPPLRLPAGCVASRQYVVLELGLSDGSVGTAYVLTRGAPVYEPTQTLAAWLVGRPLTNAIATSAEHRGTSPPQRARALADICAWDILGKVLNVPTWRLLSADAARRRALAVAGYRRHDESPEQFAHRLHELAGRGTSAVKVAAGADDLETAELLAAVRAHDQSLDLVVDMGFAAPSVGAALTSIATWRGFDLAWVEDPFPPQDASATAAVRAHRPGALIGAGDEAPPDALHDLLAHDAVDVLRVDATTTGGLTGLLDIARVTGRRMSLHVYPEVHRHVAMTLPSVEEIELFLPSDPYDFVDRFIRAEEMEVDLVGEIHPPNTLGLGMSFDRESAGANVVRACHYHVD